MLVQPQPRREGRTGDNPTWGRLLEDLDHQTQKEIPAVKEPNNMVIRLIRSPWIRRGPIRAYSTPSSPGNSDTFQKVVLGVLATGAGVWAYQSFAGPVSEVEKLKDEAAKSVTQSALSPNEWRNFKLQKVVPYNHNTSTFVFELPQGTDSGLQVASALIAKSTAREGPAACLDDKGRPVIRPYTPVTPPGQKNTLHLLIKNYPDGKLTKHIFSLKAGDQLALKGPILKWPYKPNEFKVIGMIAGGSGITPHWQIIQNIASNPLDKTKVVLLFANQREEDILLRKEFERLSQQNPEQFSIHFALDHPPKNWPNDLKGYLTSAVLKSKLPSPTLGSDVKIFVCGPPGQVAAVAGAKNDREQGELDGMLKELGFTQDQVFKFWACCPTSWSVQEGGN